VERMNPGEKVLVPTKVEAGAFPGEKLVTVDTKAGPVSGFTSNDYIIERPDGKYIVAEVKRVSDVALTVMLIGSFFTTTGLAEIAKDVRVRKAG
jgi:hypothetical protein